MSGTYDMLNFHPSKSGWIPPAERTSETIEAHADIIAKAPVVGTRGVSAATRPKWSVAWADQDRVAGAEQWRRNGHIKNILQNTGSCVGLAVTNMIFWSSITDAIWFADPTRVLFPFFGYHYGLGRLESGIRGTGDGSTGSGQAEALAKYGYLPHDLDGVPQPSNGDVIEWSGSVEMEWSDGARLPQKFLAEGKKHKFESYTLVKSIDQAVDLMASRYWGTTASDWGGLMQCPVAGSGNSRVLLNRHADQWMHQQSVLGYWYHPTLGLLFAIGNQWGYPHGDDPERVVDENTPPAAPPGVYWESQKDFQYMLDAGETFIFSGTPDFEARPGKYRMG